MSPKIIQITILNLQTVKYLEKLILNYFLYTDPSLSNNKKTRNYSQLYKLK